MYSSASNEGAAGEEPTPRKGAQLLFVEEVVGVAGNTQPSSLLQGCKCQLGEMNGLQKKTGLWRRGLGRAKPPCEDWERPLIGCDLPSSRRFAGERECESGKVRMIMGQCSIYDTEAWGSKSIETYGLRAWDLAFMHPQEEETETPVE